MDKFIFGVCLAIFTGWLILASWAGKCAEDNGVTKCVIEIKTIPYFGETK